MKPDNLPRREHDLFATAQRRLQQTTGLQVTIDGWEPHDGVDARAHLVQDTRVVPLCMAVSTHLNNTKVAVIAQRLQAREETGLLVADYVNPLMAERLKAMNLWFMDTVGNAYIQQGPIVVFVKGNKPDILPTQAEKHRVFQTTGLKLVYALLCHPELVNASYREMASIAGVALGTVGTVITDLKALDFLVEAGKNQRRLKNMEKLCRRWVEAYPEQLRPKLMLGRFSTPEKNWWQKPQLQKLGARWGGELAAEHLTQYLKPETKTVYVRDNPQELQLAFRLRRDDAGDIELLTTFWPPALDWTDKKIVHPLLVYADLLATGDARNLETAELVYEQEIAGHLSQY